MRPDLILIEDMLAAIARIEEYVAQAEGQKRLFLSTMWLFRAAQMEFVELGEAASLVSGEVKEQFPNVSWRLMKDFRNFIAHRYYEIKPDAIWNTIIDSLPSLKEQLIAIRQTLE
jgi:uncharacterized protein with HEPN domain